jgi:SHS2 domain-containing protein
MPTDTYRWVDHTAELELEIRAHTEAGVFTQALRAFIELVGDGHHASNQAREIGLTGSDDRAVLLARWLDELEFLAETEDLVPDGIQDMTVDAHGLRATVDGHTGRPRSVVKGVTYHRLAFEHRPDGYRATVVLDV